MTATGQEALGGPVSYSVMEYRIKTDAVHPREQEVVRLVEDYLKRANFPLYRIAVSVLFSAGMVQFANHRLSLELEKGVPTGKVDLIYNALYLVQKPMDFYAHVVPHQVAHVLAEVAAFKQGKEIKEHGLEWVEWVTRLAPNAIPAKHGPGDVFDPRPILLDQGGIPVIVTGCESPCHFDVVPQRKGIEVALRNGELTCSGECKKPYRVGSFNDVPPSVLQEAEYVRELKLRRLKPTT